MSWHADRSVLIRYRDGGLGPAHTSSVEVHLLACSACRDELTALVAPMEQGRLDAVWDGIVQIADAPRPTIVERLLLRLGMSEHLARLLAATPSLRASWLLGMAATLAFAVLAARGGSGDRGLFLFLVVAPLLPLAGVAASFGPRVDPAHEVGAAVPMHGFHLLLVRSAAVLGSAVAMAGVACLALPGSSWTLVTWLIPALALTTAALVLATWFPATHSALGVAAVWIVLSLGTTDGRLLRLGSDVALVEHAAVFQPAAQLIFAAVLLAAALLVLHRRDAFEAGGFT